MRKYRLRYGLSLGLLLAVPAGVQAQNSLTSRALGMGGAFTAIAEGDGGVNWNPAAAADQTGNRFAMPDLSLLNSGAGSVGDLLGGIPSNWNDRFSLIRKWSAGVTDFEANAFTGYSAPGFALSAAVEGSGQVIPYDSNGIAGHMQLSPSFTVGALQSAVNSQFVNLGFTSAQATQQTAKIMASVQKTFPGASTLLLPVYNSRVTAQANAYGAGLMTLARKLRRGLRMGINLKLVAAAHVTDTANFSGETFNAMAARVTGGIASPALIDRVFQQLNLRNSNGAFFLRRSIGR